MNRAPALPPGMAIRAPAASDLAAVLRVCRAHELADNGAPYTTHERLGAQWEALGPRLATDAWVVVAADGAPTAYAPTAYAPTAYAQLNRSGEVFVPRLWVIPTHRGIGVEAALLRRAQERARELARADGTTGLWLFAQATSTNPAARQALADAGFAVTSTYERMRRALDAPPPEPPAIPGIAIRPFVAGRDEDAVYRADEEAFLDQRGKTPRTFEQWSARLNLRAPTFDPALWLAAWDGAAVAGAALCEAMKDDAGSEPTGEVGWMHHLGVRRPWRGRGLGAALTLHALGALHRRGVRVARLNVDADSLTGAQRLYRRLGFRAVDTYANCEKTIALEAPS